MDKSLLEFPIVLYGEATRVNDVLIKQRCRIFYKYANRNGVYISDDFAEELIKTLPYVPVKGIYEGEDFTDHGESRDLGRIYGVVPVDNNFAWELHLDDDGVERSYACCDVYLYAALYPEANEIAGKSLSMELYEPTLQYHRAIIDGKLMIALDHGSFLGLQVLGDNVEPCFEGAGFYTLYNVIETAINTIKHYSTAGGKSEMPKFNFKLSDSEKLEGLLMLLNPEFDEEHDWAITYSISEVYDDYALAYNYEAGQFERVYYTKNDETDSIELGERVHVYIVDVTETEKNTLDTLRRLNGDTYAAINPTLESAAAYEAECAESRTKIDELTTNIATLNTEIETMTASANEAKAQFDALTTQLKDVEEANVALNQYKENVETARKNAVVDEYTSKLSEETLNAYRAKFADYTVEELDMHLAYELKQATPEIFSKKSESGYVPKDEGLDGVAAILARYKK